MTKYAGVAMSSPNSTVIQRKSTEAEDAEAGNTVVAIKKPTIQNDRTIPVKAFTGKNSNRIANSIHSMGRTISQNSSTINKPPRNQLGIKDCFKLPTHKKN